MDDDTAVAAGKTGIMDIVSPYIYLGGRLILAGGAIWYSSSASA